MLSGRVLRRIILAHPEINCSIFSYQTRLELQMGLTSMIRRNKEISFIAANTQDGIKSTPCVQWNILLHFWCYGPIFLLEVLDILFRDMESWILLNTNRLKINKWLTIRNLIMGHVWIFQPYNNPNTKLKNNTQKCHRAQNQASATSLLTWTL